MVLAQVIFMKDLLILFIKFIQSIRTNWEIFAGTPFGVEKTYM